MSMELRDSGSDPVQINDDETHVIVPVATHLECKLDHARMPVTWLRRADGKMHRDGSRAGLLQQHHSLVERRLHGAPGPAIAKQRRGSARITGPCRSEGEVRQSVEPRSTHDWLPLQDKSSKVRPGQMCINSRPQMNIAHIQRTLPILVMRRCCSTFDTLRRAQ